MHLRRLADQQSRSHAHSSVNDAEADEHSYRIYELEERVLHLEKDLGFVALVLGGILTTIEQKGVATRSDIWDSIRQVDGLDDFQDGQLDIDVLRRESPLVTEDQANRERRYLIIKAHPDFVYELSSRYLP